MPRALELLIMLITAVSLMAGCSTSHPDKPADTLPIAALPDLKIDLAENVEWQSPISFALSPGIPTKLKFNVNVEGNTSVTVDLVINIMKSTTVVATCSSSHKVTVDSPEVLTTPVKLEPGDYNYDVTLMVNGVKKTKNGKFNVTSK